MSRYIKLLENKTSRSRMRGLESVPELAPHLFPFQSEVVEFLLRAGGGGLFLDTGLGKTACELEWSKHAAAATNGRALILTPLAVARQIEREGQRWGYDVAVIREQSEVRDGISICNYDRIHKIDPDEFGAVALDESSVLKSFTGKTTRAILDAFKDHRFKLSATATPAPNDHMELGTQAEFCGIMQSNEMLSRFFINDSSTASQSWRLKRHGVSAFWDWMASWCRMASLPSDLGHSDKGFLLPELVSKSHHIESLIDIAPGELFATTKVSATDMHIVKRQTSIERATMAASLVINESDESWVVWCDTNYEADAIMKALAGVSGVVEVRGSHTLDQKEESLAAFAEGGARVIVTKPSVCGFGLNWQHCARTVFVGRSFSYESWYQAIRRLWRFGQAREVECHVVIAAGEETIGRVIERKAESHASMKEEMRDSMLRNIGLISEVRTPYTATHNGVIPSWI
jgi:superfamily II DNA or RNA helicase